MYQSHVVEGRIMELREDRVVTVQGDTVSTYSLRYYMLAGEEDLEAQASVREPQAEPSGNTDENNVKRSRAWRLPSFLWPLQNKDASRI